ncbi:MAG: SDR family NAD(P)-dependent oxidoreductase [Archangium sp.]|nr:SDR family NAD(P)-dependent oxidoreductase [Archangium sp.]
MHVVVTGASSGIGEAIAREYFSRNAHVTLVARRRELLEKLAADGDGKAHIVTADLSDPAQVTAWVDDAEKTGGPIDVLINNAGVQIVRPFIETPFEDAARLLQVDLLAPLRLSQFVARGMVSRKQGTLVDIASMAAIAPTPGMSFYNAAKGGLAAASEGLRAELKPHGVHVVTVYPGPVKTPMESAGRAAYEESWVARMLAPAGEASVLARLVADAVENREARIIYPFMNALGRHFPAITRLVLDAFTPRVRGS